MTSNEAHVRSSRAFTAAEWSVGDLIRATAAAHPQRIALKQVRGEGREAPDEWTYDALLGKCTAVARRLLESFEPGEHVVLWAPGSPEWIFFEFGALLAGLVFVPVNAGCKSEDLKHVLAQSGAAGLFYEPGEHPEETESILRGLGEVRARLRHVGKLQALMSAEESSATQLPSVAPDAPALIMGLPGKVWVDLCDFRAAAAYR